MRGEVLCVGQGHGGGADGRQRAILERHPGRAFEEIIRRSPEAKRAVPEVGSTWLGPAI